MKAIILASGMGKRLYPLTKRTPKSLIKIRGKPLLSYQLESIINCGIRDIVITTGPFENKMKNYVRNEYPNLKVYYVKNPKYETTNYIYSIWLTKKQVDDAVVLLHGDLLFEQKLLKKIIDAKYANCVLVNNRIRPPKKDFKAIITGDRIVKISVETAGKNAFFCPPLYKFSKSDFLFWLNEMEQFIKQGYSQIYAEEVFNQISDKITLQPVFFDKELCMEIDTLKDLEKARALLKDKL